MSIKFFIFLVFLLPAVGNTAEKAIPVYVSNKPVRVVEPDSSRAKKFPFSHDSKQEYDVQRKLEVVRQKRAAMGL